MEDLSELLKLCLHIKAFMGRGDTIRTALTHFFDQNRSEFTLNAQQWLFYFDQTVGIDKSKQIFKKNHAVVLFSIIAFGLKGHSVHERLSSYEEELIDACKDEIQKKIDRLPYELMIPILLFMFPAYLLVILGPILNLFLKSL